MWLILVLMFLLGYCLKTRQESNLLVCCSKEIATRMEEMNH